MREIEPGTEIIISRLQWPMRGNALVWEVVACRLDIEQRTVLETWTDCKRAIQRAAELTRERITALPDYRETVN